MKTKILKLKITEQGITFCFYLLFFFTPLIFSTLNSELFEFPKMYFVYGIAIIIISLWLARSIQANKIIFQRTFWDIPLLLFLVSQIVSTILSIDRHTSVWGYYSRSYGGLLSSVVYALLYWAFVSNINFEKLKKTIRFLLSAGIIISVWGAMEHFGKSPSCLVITGEFNASCWRQNVSERVFATLGQPNWLAAYLTALLPLTWAAALKSEKKNKLLWLGVFTLFLSTLIFTKSRSGLLGFAAEFIVFWGVIFIKHITQTQLKTFIPITMISLLLLVGLGTPWTPSLLSRLNQPKSEDGENHMPSASPKTQSIIVTPSQQIRLIVWRGALDIWKRYPLFGTGVETFGYTYYWFRPVEHNYTSEWKLLYNRAHNEYLNYLANTGLVGFLAYLTLILSVFTHLHPWGVSRFTPLGTNGENRTNVGTNVLPATLLSGWSSLLVTNFFGFSVVSTGLLFFLMPGMAVAAISDKRQAISIKNKLLFKQGLFLFFLLLITFLLLLRLVQFWYADTLYKQGRDENRKLNGMAALAPLQRAVEIRSDEPWYWDELAESLSLAALSLHENSEEQKAKELAVLAKETSDKAISMSPYQLNFWRGRAVMMQRLAGIDSKYLDMAIESLELAVGLAPTEPRLYYNLGVLYQRVGEDGKAREMIKRAVRLKSDYRDAVEALEILKEE